MAQTLQPGQRKAVQPPPMPARQEGGGLVIEYEGEGDELVVEGVLEAESWIQRLPVGSEAGSHGYYAYDSLAIPFRSLTVGNGGGQPDAGSMRTVWLATRNLHDEPQDVTLRLLGISSPQHYLDHTWQLGPREVASLRLDELLRDALSDAAPAQARLAVSSGRGVFQPLLVSMTPEGVPYEVSLSSHSGEHHGGRYPLPELDRHDVYTYILNLGDEDAELVGQVSWDGGTYAFGPVQVPAGAITTLDFRSMAQAQVPDMLGRVLEDGPLGRGFIQWSARGGARHLIARTEARPLDSEDQYGFNCAFCCFTYPSGRINPGTANFPIPGPTPFQAEEWRTTCTGEMGPYPPYNPSFWYSSPLSWNGWTASATAHTNQNVWFHGDGEIVADTCQTIPGGYGGGGNVRTQCGDVRDTIIEEYETFNVAFRPTCNDFSSSGGSANFSWARYNGGFSQGNPHNPWGIVRQRLMDGMEATLAIYARGRIMLNSGYRCPHGNDSIDNASPTSRHMWGQSADFYSLDHPNTLQELELLRNAAQLAGGTELIIYYPTRIHVHATWP
jgi:hypothetical protein